MEQSSRIFVAGHTGFAGSALVRRLEAEGFENLVLRTRAELDLGDPAAVTHFFEAEKPEYVFLVAGRVGGIQMHLNRPADLMRDNLVIANAVIPAAHQCGARKLLFFASAACYPEHAPQPIPEASLLTAPLDPVLAPYALAKIAGIKLCEAYDRQFGFHAISAMLPNLYGPGDHFEPDRSHAMASLIRRFTEARVESVHEVVVWGSGRQRREFLHVDDLASAAIFLMRNYDRPEPINVGAGGDVTIASLAQMIRKATGYLGDIRFDGSKPEGAARRLLDSSSLNALGWKASIPLERGVQESCEEYANRLGATPESARRA